jgi:AraC family transcriptional regulator
MTAEEHFKRIRKVLIYIDENINEELSLEKLAEIATYSSFHFHRIFRGIIGETLQEYINRNRMEKSAMLLSHHKNKSLEEVFSEVGFKSNSAFSKTFKKFFGVSPSVFRKNTPEKFSKILPMNSNIGQKEVVFQQYLYNINQMKNFMETNAKIEVKELHEMHLASVLSIGVQNIDNAYNKLISWGISKNLFPRENVKMISVYHDSFKVTAPNKVRIHACMLLDEPIKTDGETFPETLPKGRHIVGSYFIGIHEFEKAWQILFLWMNENGYQYKRTFPFEIYHKNFKEHPEKKCRVDFCIPIL